MRAQAIVDQTFPFFVGQGPPDHARVLLVERPTEQPQVITDLERKSIMNFTAHEAHNQILKRVITSDPTQ